MNGMCCTIHVVPSVIAVRRIPWKRVPVLRFASRGFANGKLFVVATPIGNLGDLSKRAAKTLIEVPVIATESVHSAETLVRTLLRDEGMSNSFAEGERLESTAAQSRPQRFVSYHSHNEKERVPELLAALGAGDDVALVSRVGTPGWRDPGQILVSAAHESGFQVRSLPGPCSVAAALSVSGLSGDRLAFEGYLPALRDARIRRLHQIRGYMSHSEVGGMTLALFADGGSLDDILTDVEDVLGAEVGVCIAKDISMPHERILSAQASVLRSAWSSLHVDKKRGAVVLLIELPALSGDAGHSSEVTSDFERNGQVANSSPVGESEIRRVVSLLLKGGVAPQKTTLLAMQLTGVAMSVAQKAVQEASLGKEGSTSADASHAAGDGGRRSHARQTLHLVNLGPHATKDELAWAMEQAGLPLGNMEVAENHVGEKIAFIRYASEQDAMVARMGINSAGMTVGSSRRQLVAGWARRDRWIM